MNERYGLAFKHSTKLNKIRIVKTLVSDVSPSLRWLFLHLIDKGRLASEERVKQLQGNVLGFYVYSFNAPFYLLSISFKGN